MQTHLRSLVLNRDCPICLVFFVLSVRHVPLSSRGVPGSKWQSGLRATELSTTSRSYTVYDRHDFQASLLIWLWDPKSSGPQQIALMDIPGQLDCALHSIWAWGNHQLIVCMPRAGLTITLTESLETLDRSTRRTRQHGGEAMQERMGNFETQPSIFLAEIATFYITSIFVNHIMHRVEKEWWVGAEMSKNIETIYMHMSGAETALRNSLKLYVLSGLSCVV